MNDAQSKVVLEWWLEGAFSVTSMKMTMVGVHVFIYKPVCHPFMDTC